MKLLIVDDEELTRTGVISSIDWKALGIEEVLQADDGINGLEMAKQHRPEIILCDVRMPRMTISGTQSTVFHIFFYFICFFLHHLFDSFRSSFLFVSHSLL